ncbi:MAG: hypothetical protein RL385_2077 [Pseudomonadota bacterium]
MNHTRLFSCAALLLAAACAPSKPKVDPHEKPLTESLYELDLTRPQGEQGADFIGTHKAGLHEAIARVRELAAEPLARGLFVRLGGLSGRQGDVEEWAAAFEAFRAEKKPVHCHFDELDNLGFALGSHCDVLSMTPAGTLELVGLAAQTLHGQELLERIGVEADLLQVGKYKGASEPFTRNAMSDELRVNLTQLLDDLELAFAKHLGTRTQRTPEELRALLDAGPFDADGAVARKLVDRAAFDDEARAHAKTAASARNVVRLFPTRDHKSFSLRDLLEAFSDEEPKREARPSLGLVYLDGEIVDGEETGGNAVASDPFVRKLRALGDDREVRAVVLRIESPGGSALASDRMWHAVHRVAQRKPVVVSLGDMAASGGYYVASAGSHVFANASSIVGSIGVVGGKMVAKELGEHVGVHSSTIARGAHATWLSVLTPFSPEERTILSRLLTRTYDRFLERIAEGRKRSVEELSKAAEGRVMGGERALSHGLIDALGSLNDALEYARKQGKLPKDAPILEWPEAHDPMHVLASQLGASAPSVVSAEALVAALGFNARASLPETQAVGALARKPGSALAILPFAVRVR